MPAAVRFLLQHAVIGFGFATLFIAAVLLADPGGLATLLRRAEGHPMPLLVLWFFAGLSFGAAQIGLAMIPRGREE